MYCSLINLFYSFYRYEGLTAKFYGAKVYRYLKMQQHVAQWEEFCQLDCSDSLECLLEGTVMISQWGQMIQEKVPSLEAVVKIIDGIAERVAQLVGACAQKSSKQTVEFINQVLYNEMGFHSPKADDPSLDNFYIDKVDYFPISTLRPSQ